MNISSASISRLLRRYHGILFAVLVLGGLIIMVITLNSIISGSSPSASQTPNPVSGFDQKTINQLNSLHSIDQQPTPLNFSGRSNPFVE